MFKIFGTYISFYCRAIQYKFLFKTNNFHNTLETLKSHFEFHIKIDAMCVPCLRVHRHATR